jgi:hypothetical protein
MQVSRFACYSKMSENMPDSWSSSLRARRVESLSTLLEQGWGNVDPADTVSSPRITPFSIPIRICKSLLHSTEGRLHKQGNLPEAGNEKVRTLYRWGRQKRIPQVKQVKKPHLKRVLRCSASWNYLISATDSVREPNSELYCTK